MAPMVCRIKYRKGEPLSLTVYPGLTFISLPFEIRERIYQLLLTASEPITVNPKVQNPILLSNSIPVIQIRERFTGLLPLTSGLIAVNKLISTEAAAVFYRQNTFKFEIPEQGQHFQYKHPYLDPWDLLYSFLYIIGDINRASLRSLEVEISRPRAIAKEPDGTIISRLPDSLWLRKVHVRDQHLRPYPPVWDYDPYLSPSFDYVSPAIEAVFRLLGSKQQGIQLVLKTGLNNLPEIRVDHNGLRFGWSNEVPDHIEQMRERFTTTLKDKSQVEVLWETLYKKPDFLSKIKTIEKDGWEVLKILDIFGPFEKWDKGPKIIATLRRKGRFGSEAVCKR